MLDFIEGGIQENHCLAQSDEDDIVWCDETILQLAELAIRVLHVRDYGFFAPFRDFDELHKFTR